MWFEVVEGQNAEIGQGWVVLTRRGRYLVNALGTASLLELRGGCRRGSMWACFYAWFEVVGGRDAEIGQGWVLLTPTGRYRANALGTAWPSKMHGGRGIWSVWADANAWFEVVGGRDLRSGGGGWF